MNLNEFTIGGLTIYEIIWFFMIYSFLGWVLEVIYNAAAQGKVINRGFLNGPVCPIYGFGMILIIVLLNTLFPEGAAAVHGAVLFGFGLVLASAVELIGGFALDKIFHARWWDYSDKPLNLNGYVCPEFSLYWGLGTVVAIRMLHPFVAGHTVEVWPEKIGWPIAIVFSLVYMADLTVTVMIVSGMNKELEKLDELSTSMRRVSDDLSVVLGTSSIKTVQRMEQGRVKAELAREMLKEQAEQAKMQIEEQAEQKRSELEEQTAQVQAQLQSQKEELEAQVDAKLKELQDKADSLLNRRASLESEIDAMYSRILKSRIFGPRRLFMAFPDLKIPDHREILEEIKKKL